MRPWSDTRRNPAVQTGSRGAVRGWVRLIDGTILLEATMELGAKKRIMESDEWNFEGVTPCRQDRQTNLKSSRAIA
jgi:hypothetical protein